MFEDYRWLPLSVVTTYVPAPLAELTTLRLGGPARRLVRAGSGAELVEALRAADSDGEPLLLVGGGSNLVIADAGFAGTAVAVASSGLSVRRVPDGPALVTVEAGQDWDSVVEATLAEGLSGLECLSGIPGRAGAVPVQNVGAYGVEIAERLVDVDLYDRASGSVRVHVPAASLGLVYRGSVLKGRDDAVVLRVRLALDVTVGAAGRGNPVRYAELASVLGVGLGEPAPPARVRAAVLELRRSKGMVLDPADHDTWSVGSFFTNPVLSSLPPELVGVSMPSWSMPDGRVKLSAAWLISNAGFARGHAGPGGRVSLSGKHSLALTNRGAASTEDLLALAREVRAGVLAAFGVTLTPEPVLVGCAL
jgi:UDP-N-acetylmuramate dehydrogenase